MALIGNLVAKISTDTRGFKKGIYSTQKMLGGLKSRVIGVTGALAGLAGAASFTVLVKNSLASVDATAKLSDQMGITIRNLKGMQFAAEQSGSSVETFNASIQKMNRNIGDAITGTGIAGPMFRRLGLDVQQLANMDAGESFKQIADRIASIKNPAEQSAAAFAIFGRKGQELLTMINAGSEGIAAMVDENERLGNSFSRVDAAKVEAANDAINRISKSVMGFGQSIAIEIAPVIEDLSRRITEGFDFKNAAKKVTGFAQHLVDSMSWAAKTVSSVWSSVYGFVEKSSAIFFGGLVGDIQGTLDELELIHIEQAKLAAAPKYEPPDLGKVGEGAKKSLAELDEYEDRISKLSAFSDKLKEDLKTPFEKMTEQVEKLNDALKQGFVDASTFDKALAKIKTDFFDEQNSDLKSFADSVKQDIQTPIQEWIKTVDRLRDARDKGFLTQNEWKMAFDKANDKYYSAIKPQEDGKEEIKKESPVRRAEILDARSTGAARLLLANLGIKKSDTKKQLDIQKQQLKEQKNTNTAISSLQPVKLEVASIA